MLLIELKDKMAEVLKDRSAPRDRHRLVYEFSDLVSSLEAIAEAGETPERVRGKARSFLDLLSRKAEEHGARFWHDGYALNVVGEAMVTLRYVAEPVLRFLSSGLYFYGISHIERNHRRQGPGLMAAHADHLVEYTGRQSIKAVLRDGQRALEEKGRFCLVYHYVNSLKKKYWADKRRSNDACDCSVPLIEENDTSCFPDVDGSSDPVMGAQDRVILMLRLFAERLTPDQQKVYLMRQKLPGIDSLRGSAANRKLGAFLEEFDNGGDVGRTWSSISASLGMTEKSAKREYLRGLLILLRESSAVVLGGDRPPRFVRRMMSTLQSIVQERDLRIRDNAGRGLGKIVERWQVALRFVLNHGIHETAERPMVAGSGETQ